jgi:hypothetical protein
VRSVTDQRADQVEERAVFWPVSSISKKFTDGHWTPVSQSLGSADALRRASWKSIARQEPGVPVATFVQNSFGHGDVIGPEALGSLSGVGISKLHAAILSSLSAPRMTIVSTSSGSGR